MIVGDAAARPRRRTDAIVVLNKARLVPAGVRAWRGSASAAPHRGFVVRSLCDAVWRLQGYRGDRRRRGGSCGNVLMGDRPAGESPRKG